MRSNEFDRHMLWFIVLTLATFLLAALGCSSMEHRREQLQLEHPDCFVFHDLNIECPNPFDSSAGFGIEVHNEKPKKKKTKRKD